VTDHLEPAADRAIELARHLILGEGVDTAVRATEAAQHLTYLAGLIRGGTAQPTPKATVTGWDGKLWVGGIQFDDPSETDAEVHEEERDELASIDNRIAHDLRRIVDKVAAVGEGKLTLNPIETAAVTDPGEAARNFRASATAVAEGVDPHSNTWAAGVRHGYLHAANALDKVAATADQHKAFIQGQLKDRRDRLAAAEKRWHEATAQRDALVRAAREVFGKGLSGNAEDALREVVEQSESGVVPYANADRLRRELWRVLDRMPASDDDLIATVQKLKEQP
jgi:hypothetical protein